MSKSKKAAAKGIFAKKSKQPGGAIDQRDARLQENLAKTERLKALRLAREEAEADARKGNK